MNITEGISARKRFILLQVAAFETCRSEIAKRLNDPEYSKRFGFRVGEISPQRVGKIISKFTPEDIGLERAKFLADFSDLPLAFKKPRVNELCKAYRELTKNPSAYGKGVLRARLEILRDIKNEIGEDIDKLAKALGRTGDQHLHFNFGDVSDDRRDQIRRNITAAWPVTTDRF